MAMSSGALGTDSGGPSAPLRHVAGRRYCAVRFRDALPALGPQGVYVACAGGRVVGRATWWGVRRGVGRQWPNHSLPASGSFVSSFGLLVWALKYTMESRLTVNRRGTVRESALRGDSYQFLIWTP